MRTIFALSACVALIGCWALEEVQRLPDGSVASIEDGSVLGRGEFCALLEAAVISRNLTCVGGDANYWIDYLRNIRCDQLSYCNAVADSRNPQILFQERLGRACLRAMARDSCETVDPGYYWECTSAFSVLADCSGGLGCGIGLRCEMRGPDAATCVEVPKIGGPGEICDENEGCEAGLFCSSSGNCVGPSSAGGDCLRIPCNHDSYCDFADWKCRPKKPTGANCASTAECSGGLRCRSTCQPIKRLGDVCQADYDCPQGTVCRSERCSLALRRGDSCIQEPPDSCYLNSHCAQLGTDYVCVANTPRGELCGSLEECSCSQGVCQGFGATIWYTCE